MTSDVLKKKMTDYIKALNKLQEALERDSNDDIVIDAVIQRFEFTYELAWKLIKAYLAYNGIAEVRSPREALKEGYSLGLIGEGEMWIKMLEDRNITSHTYNEQEAILIYNNIKNNYFHLLFNLKENMNKEF